MKSLILLNFKLLALCVASSPKSTENFLKRSNGLFTSKGVQKHFETSSTIPPRKPSVSPSSSDRADSITSFPETTPATTNQHRPSGINFIDISSITSWFALGGSVVVLFVAVVLLICFRQHRYNSSVINGHDTTKTEMDNNPCSDIIMERERDCDQPLCDKANYATIVKDYTVEENAFSSENCKLDKTNEPHKRLEDAHCTRDTKDNDTAGRHKNKDGLVYVDIEFGNNDSTRM